MDIQQKDRAIKRINERYTDLARSFGANSAIARRFLTKMRAVFGEDNLHKAKARQTKGTKRRQSAADMGLSLVSRNNETKNVSDEDIKALLSYHTSGEIKKTVKEQAKEESNLSQASGGPPVTANDILEAMDYISDLEQDDDPYLYEAYKMYWESVGGPGNPRPSYITIAEIHKDIVRQNAAIESGDTKLADNIEDKIRKRLKAVNRFNAGQDYFGGI